MGILFMIVAGAVLGWLAAFLFRADETGTGIQHNLAGGIGGALIGGLVIGPLIGEDGLISGRYDIPALLISIGGSVLTLLPVNLLARRISG